MRPNRLPVPAALLALFTSFAPSLAGQADPPVEYSRLTNPLAAATNFNVETVRGMTVASDGSLYAINTHANTIVRHADLTPGWNAEWPTLHNPVAITLWNDRLLVVGGSSWSLAEHDRTTGRILRHTALAAEPADIVVDATNQWAYVACQGSNVVVRIDLVTFTENARYAIPSQRPRFLYLDATNTVAPFVYVAPFLSGNNTVPSAQSALANSSETEILAQVLDLDSYDGTDLPDEDLYRIDPFAPPALAVKAVLHGAGTMITEHGRNPATGTYWLIGTESTNGDPGQQGEHQHRGRFAHAQLAIARVPGFGTRPEPGRIVDLDIPRGGGAKLVKTSMSFPFALAFHPSGAAVIASSTGDLLTFTDSNGNRLFDRTITTKTHPSTPPMPDVIGRAIPRDLLFDPTNQILFVYCWGWNKVLVYQWNNIQAAPYWLELGPDPQPIAVQQGRSIFYDARRPQAPGMFGSVTCSTCHPAGGMDLLGWQLSDSTKDRKDAMVTQSLLSIADTFPYHWRGERNLDHFNSAFVGLLGQKEPLGEEPGGELDQFEAFVFSLQAPANPRQSVDRVLDGALAPHGQDVFLNKPGALGPFRCNGCHAMPSGTNGNRVADFFVPIASTATLDVAHLRQLTHKDQGPVTVDVIAPDGTQQTLVRARNGFGIAHQGTASDLFEFLGSPFNLDALQRLQVTEFVRQFDQGIAPAAHRAYLLAQNNAAQQSVTISNVLMAQAAPSKRWVDVAAIGHEVVGTATLDLRWAYDPATGLFRCHDPSQPARSFATFVQRVTAGSAQYLFVGLPPGNSWCYAIDPDNDGLDDAQEVARGTQQRQRDTDRDGYDDGYEVQVASDPLVANVPLDTTPPALRVGTTLVRDHEGATFAKFSAEFTEPVTWTLEAVDAGGNVVSATRGAALQRQATIHMHELFPSTPDALPLIGDIRTYLPRLTLTDSRHNPTVVYGSSFAAKPMLLRHVPEHPPVLIDGLALLQPVQRNNGTMTVDATLRVRFKSEFGGVIPVPGRVVVAHVLTRRGATQPWLISRNSPTQTVLVGQQGTQVAPQILIDSSGTLLPYNALQGDFLLSPLTVQGNTTFHFARSGLAAGDEVRLAILAVLEPRPGPLPTFDLFSMFDWDLPSTAGDPTPTVPGNLPEQRGLTATY